MNKERVKDLVFALFMIVVLALAIIYFTVPERTMFLNNTIEWWLGFLK